MQRFLSWLLMIRFLKSIHVKRLRKSQDILWIIVLKLVGSVSVVYNINLWIQLVCYHSCTVLAWTRDRSSSELYNHTTKPASSTLWAWPFSRLSLSLISWPSLAVAEWRTTAWRRRRIPRTTSDEILPPSCLLKV